MALDGFAEFRTKQALDGVWRLFGAANAFVEATAPWHLAKNPERAGRLDQVLNAALESLRVGAVLISPVMPSAARKLWAMLGLPGGPGMDRSPPRACSEPSPQSRSPRAIRCSRASKFRDPLGRHPLSSASERR